MALCLAMNKMEKTATHLNVTCSASIIHHKTHITSLKHVNISKELHLHGTLVQEGVNSSVHF